MSNNLIEDLINVNSFRRLYYSSFCDTYVKRLYAISNSYLLLIELIFCHILISLIILNTCYISVPNEIANLHFSILQSQCRKIPYIDRIESLVFTPFFMVQWWAGVVQIYPGTPKSFKIQSLFVTVLGFWFSFLSVYLLSVRIATA